jgi:hypothetical protein
MWRGLVVPWVGGDGGWRGGAVGIMVGRSAVDVMVAIAGWRDAQRALGEVVVLRLSPGWNRARVLLCEGSWGWE